MSPGAGADEWTGTISVADMAVMAGGGHNVYVHGSDGALWGAFNFAVLDLDKLGPATTGLTLTPNPSDGSLDVAVSATGNDSATGSSDVIAAEFFIGTPGGDGSGTAMTVNLPAPVASFRARRWSSGLASRLALARCSRIFFTRASRSSGS